MDNFTATDDYDDFDALLEASSLGAPRVTAAIGAAPPDARQLFDHAARHPWACSEGLAIGPAEETDGQSQATGTAPSPVTDEPRQPAAGHGIVLLHTSGRGKTAFSLIPFLDVDTGEAYNVSPLPPRHLLIALSRAAPRAWTSTRNRCRTDTTPWAPEFQDWLMEAWADTAVTAPWHAKTPLRGAPVRCHPARESRPSKRSGIEALYREFVWSREAFDKAVRNPAENVSCAALQHQAAQPLAAPTSCGGTNTLQDLHWEATGTSARPVRTLFLADDSTRTERPDLPADCVLCKGWRDHGGHLVPQLHCRNSGTLQPFLRTLPSLPAGNTAQQLLPQFFPLWQERHALSAHLNTSSRRPPWQHSPVPGHQQHSRLERLLYWYMLRASAGELWPLPTGDGRTGTPWLIQPAEQTNWPGTPYLLTLEAPRQGSIIDQETVGALSQSLRAAGITSDASVRCPHGTDSGKYTDRMVAQHLITGRLHSDKESLAGNDVDRNGTRVLPLPVRLTYRATDPYAVEAVFNPGDGQATWVFARDLLADGLRGRTGSGDVAVWTSSSDSADARTFIELSPPAGTALISLPHACVREFLDQTTGIVATGAEHAHVRPSLNDFEAQLNQLSGIPGGWN
ncbi:SsgA family sporulation/cell division regulator [Streptomyces niveus]|uniref:SsgA family sporulation/cell division regulator n=1 Tax=Streptomyces niveus TaxID=193462 RepID=UPI00340EFAF1